jgi:hypothetical protein
MYNLGRKLGRMSLAREGKPVSRKWLLVAASTTLIVVLAGCGLITLGVLVRAMPSICSPARIGSKMAFASW